MQRIVHEVKICDFCRYVCANLFVFINFIYVFIFHFFCVFMLFSSFILLHISILFYISVYYFYYVLFGFALAMLYLASTCSHVISVRTQDIRGCKGKWCCVCVLLLTVTTSPFFIWDIKEEVVKGTITVSLVGLQNVVLTNINYKKHTIAVWCESLPT